MAETLSYQEAPQPELNADEQESLEIGEQMQQDQEQLLAGKYNSPEQLEKAYLELQSKLGAQESEQVEEPTDQPEPEPQRTKPEETEPKKTENDKPQLTEEDVEYLQDLAGGKDGYDSMLKWAASALNQKEIDMYDSVMEDGNPNSIYFAVHAMLSRYNDATGTEGKLLTGKGSSNNQSEFRSQAELVKAMSDPRYDSDPAYRDDIMQQLERSNLNF
tara:strand:- start:191 stop:841 length:651 start_codon:yes stop_codon:yes gene_type:complete